MGEYDCRKCGKSFRSHRALSFHMEGHKDDDKEAEWQAKRERSRAVLNILASFKNFTNDEN